jgi:hypothetical protein
VTGCKPDGLAVTDRLHLKTMRDVLRDHFRVSEATMNGPDGGPCGPDTRGLLQPRTVSIEETHLIGKEAVRVDETQAGLWGYHETQNRYRDPAGNPLDPLVRNALRVPLMVSALADRTGVSPRTIERSRRDGHLPSRKDRALITTATLELARARLRSAGHKAPMDKRKLLGSFLEMVDAQKICAGCGRRLHGKQQKWCEKCAETGRKTAQQHRS